jgi:hypothetical protein
LNFYRLKDAAAGGVGLASAALRHIGARFCRRANNKIGGLMFRSHNHAGLIAGALVAASIAMAATASSAMPRYDGLWSVSIVTKKGDCIASYRYPMRIANGVLANGGDIAIDVSGKVTAYGAVTVVVSHGDTRAAGAGRLVANAGNGSWKTSSCSGSWTAERRS